MVSSFKRIQKIDILFVLLCTLLLSIPASYEPHHIAKTLFFGAFIQSLAYSLILAFFASKWKIFKIVVFSVLYLLFSVETFTYIVFNSRFNPSILTLILQTSLKEISEFTSVYLLNWKVILYVLLLIVLYAFILIVLEKYNRVVLRFGWKGIVIIVLYIVFGLSIPFISLPFPLGQNTINELYVSGVFVADNHSEIEGMKEMLENISITSANDNAYPPVVVLVIGESFNKHHSSLYGYYLPTSPYLESEKKKSRLTVFTDAHTPTNGTSFAMKYIFTLKSCNDETDNKYIIVPTVFKKAGYRVVYIDNQYTRSSSGELDYSCVYFLNPTRINDSSFDYRNDDTRPHDGEFIDDYGKYLLKEGKALNIIHLYGQHFDSKSRYPNESFSLFTANDIQRSDLNETERMIVAEYDNATLYNDYVLSKIINIFKESDAVIIYLSDHGEQIYDDKQHLLGRTFGSYKEPVTLKNVYEVPFMVWCSDTFKARHAEKYEAIKSSAAKKICIDDVGYLMLDLADIDFNYHRPGRSVINSNYISHKTIIDK